MFNFGEGYSAGPLVHGEKLFVGNLPCDATESEIWSVFAPFGQVLEVFCLGPSKSKSGQACAFIRYADSEAAMAAVQHLDGRMSLRPHECPNLSMQVRRARGVSGETAWSPHNRKESNHQQAQLDGAVRLFVGNLPVDISSEELHCVFLEAKINIFENETFIMTGRSRSANAVCAFVVARNEDESKRAIETLHGKKYIREKGPIKVRVANHSTTPSVPKSRKPRAYSDPVLLSPPNVFVNPASVYGTGHFLLPTPEYVNWKEPSIKTYHHYMFLPQSANYGPLHIIPGNEPWRNNGIYSLPSASYTPEIG